jgi:hypothetical protein
MVIRKSLLLNMDLGLFCFRLILMKVPVCEQSKLHTKSAGDQTQNSLNESPVSYRDTVVQFRLTCDHVSLQLQSCYKAESSLLTRTKQSDSSWGPGMVTKWTLCSWIGETSKKCFALLLAEVSYSL